MYQKRGYQIVEDNYSDLKLFILRLIVKVIMIAKLLEIEKIFKTWYLNFYTF